MSSLVRDLQRAALDTSTSVTTLLRMALVVATKLNLAEFASWVQSELKGYSDPDRIPQYRVLCGEPVVYNPFRGWESFFTHNLDPEVAHRLRTFKLHYPLAELEDHLRSEDAAFVLTYNEQTERMLIRTIRPLPVRPGVRYERSQFRGILDAVRNIVLEWSLKLEQDGILGEEMTFSEAEKEAATAEAPNIAHYIHQVINSQVQLGGRHAVMNVEIRPLDPAVVKEVIQALKRDANLATLEVSQRSELMAEIGTVEAQLGSSKPKEVIIREGLSSIRNILEGAVGSALAAGILPRLASLLG
jgi:hypothetical protein